MHDLQNTLSCSRSGSEEISLESLICIKKLPNDTWQTASLVQQGWVWITARELPKIQDKAHAAFMATWESHCFFCWSYSFFYFPNDLNKYSHFKHIELKYLKFKY